MLERKWFWVSYFVGGVGFADDLKLLAPSNKGLQNLVTKSQISVNNVICVQDNNAISRDALAWKLTHKNRSLFAYFGPVTCFKSESSDYLFVMTA